MDNNNIVKTEVKLSEDSVQKIISAKVAEMLMGQEEFVKEFVNQLLTKREPKQYSRDPENPTYFQLWKSIIL